MRQFNIMAGSLVRWLSVFVVLGMCAGYAQAETQNSITALNVDTGNGTTVIKVKLDQPLAGLPAGFSINTPPRIAFDFPNTVNGLGKSSQEFNNGDLRSANIVQAGNRTRLVVNLNQMLAYETKLDGNSLVITLHDKPADTVSSNTARFAEAKQAKQKYELRDIDFRRGKNGEGRIQVDLSDPGIGIDIRQQGTTLIVDFLKTDLPRNLQHKLDVVDFATPVQNVDTFVQGDNVRMVIEPSGQWDYAAYQTDNKFIVEVKPVVADKQGSGSKPGYTGEKLTLNFQKIDVREALNVIADFTGLNIVISDSVKGDLTLRLKDVPWDQAFDIILQSRGLDMRKNGNVIQVAPREELAAKEKLDLTSHQEIADLEELRTESFQLSYQKGDVVAAMLSNDKQRILSKRGSAVVDKRTNTVFVQDTPTNLEGVRKLIKQIDVPVRQVMIEARVVEATDNFSKNLGVRLGYNSADQFNVGNTGVNGNIGSNSATIPTGIAPPGVANPGVLTPLAIGGLTGGGTPINLPNVNLPSAGTAGTFSMLLFNSSVSKILSVELTALETDSKGKVISSPRVVTSDQTEATISSGTEIPYQQATSSGATSVSFAQAALSLSVKPQITPDDNVIMDIKVNKDSVGQLYAGVPSINTNKVNTQVLVENGGTVVIGGIYIQEQSTGANKVPFLGDLPVIGFLFRSTAELNNKSELLVFISPKIIKDEMSLR
ncbi:MAG: secretin [Candidatus Gallionella acididurans]|uniref:Type IV pilus biogenesis and competence protein PilQ n=1 Tax=Candidatus Gallionella acididurans TaxID=1796491 RepID=A0A139BXF9_9PROT|nr:MAG: secretin [Candidatus Gallionella acididurans]